MKTSVSLTTRFFALAFIGAVTLTGCVDGILETDDKEKGSNSRTLDDIFDLSAFESRFTGAAGRADAVVGPESSIQAAVDQASPGAVIVIEPGTYAEAVTIDKPNITLMGRPGQGTDDGVVIQNPGGAANGITVNGNGDGVRLFNFTVRGFARNGVLIREVEGFQLVRITAEDNGDYGLFPTRSSRGIMLHCRASGHADAGLYVGQSTDVRMLHNTVFENVIGIEASNSSRIELSHNTAENNTIGILSVLLPPSPFRTVLTASDMTITHNVVRDNNHPNFADPGSLPSSVPPGSGILVVGVDRTVVETNTVTGNDWVGIGLGSTATFGMLAGIPDVGLADPHPDLVIIRKNALDRNGTNPPAPPFPLPGVDLLWDGTGTGNCWEKNTYSSSFPAPLPSCEDVL